MTESNEPVATAAAMLQIARAPAFVFLLVAAADGNIDKKEMRQFVKTLQKPRFAILAAVIQESGVPLTELIKHAAAYLPDPTAELQGLRQLTDKVLPADHADAFKVGLLLLGKEVAEASGGFLGLFGSKIDNNERVALAFIARTLGLTDEGDADDSPAASTSAPVGTLENPVPGEPLNADDLPDNLFPALKAAEWVDQAKQYVAMQSIYGNDDFHAGDPVIGYVLDCPETVEFVNADTLGAGCSLEQLHQAALVNLDRRLAGAVEWEELKFNPDSELLGEVSGLTLAGDYFAAEALLSETMMNTAHGKLGSDMLMAVAPSRGELFVSQLVSKENPERELMAFAHFAITRHFHPEQAPISPIVWIVQAGKLVGKVQGMDDLIASARAAADENRASDEALLQHTATLSPVRDGKKALCISVDVRDLEVMVRELQHVVRSYVSQVIRRDDFSGSVLLALEINAPDFSKSGQSEVSTAVEEMCDFLTRQYESGHQKTVSGDLLSVSCGTIRAAAA